jgi:hypothetical protein
VAAGELCGSFGAQKNTPMRSGLMHKLKRALSTLLRPVFGFVFRLLPSRDPWERWELGLEVSLFGSSEYFRAYGLRESAVPVGSVEEICEWLLGCEYCNQAEPCSERDFWPPPSDFEGSRRGDCKDHALWAWRKLNELGIAAELVCGQARAEDEDFQAVSTCKFFEGHAWVQFQRDGVECLFEPSVKDRGSMIRPLAGCRAYYIPWFAVGPNFVRYKYWGYAYSLFGLTPSRASRGYGSPKAAGGRG